MSKVYFASSKVAKMEANATLPAKFERLLEKTDIQDKINNKRVMIKMHIGGGIGYTTIHPIFLRKLVDFIKQNKGQPFITDINNFDVIRGYTPEVIGCNFYPVTGLRDTNYFTKKFPEGYGVKEIQIGGIVKDADFLITFSHSKGHGHSGYGGAIKNLAMGFLTAKSRGDIHATMSARPFWNKNLCIYCRLCAKNCRTKAITFNDKNELSIDFHSCIFCMRCVAVCPKEALKLNMSNYSIFQRAMAMSIKTTLDELKGNYFHVNVIMNVTPFCDCWGFSTPAIIPDVGILGSHDIVSIEKASLDLIDKQKYIQGTLPGHLKMSKIKGHLFKKIWGKDPYIQVKEAESLGLGETKYNIEEIR
ncbi:MAG: DUF362 domain-containing protein [Actinobacteria bacterium]|nr:DUF362 domain-containing protein [Actinomycetota bacterium]